jgi:hypothetical protein
LNAAFEEEKGMKAKLFLTGILSVALVFGFMASCELGAKTDGSEDGIAIVFDEGSRALSTDLAKQTINYYEVVFWNNATGQVAYAKGYKGQTLRVQIPLHDYDGTTNAGKGKAVVFAGDTDTQTLLAVGELVDVYNNGAWANTSTEVVANTTAVKFKLYALESSLTTTSSSTFVVDTSTYGTQLATNTDYLYFPVVNNGLTSALFMPIPTTWTSTVGPIVLSTGKVNISYLPANGLGYPTLGDGFTEGEIALDNTPAAGTVVTNTNLKFNVGGDISAKTPPFDKGLTILSFNIPVTAIAKLGTTGGITDRKEGIEWYIRPGLIAYTADKGDTGAGILLMVGNPSPLDPASTNQGMQIGF